MTSLLELFSTDRKLLETRGSLIIRQLCGSLNAERIYRTCAEILEADEVRRSLRPSMSLRDVLTLNMPPGSRLFEHHGPEPQPDHDHLAGAQ